jgi:hypothetical protein
MSAVIQPTVGRKVWYYPSEYDRGLHASKPETIIQGSVEQPYDATVVYAHSERLVNLMVVDHNGNIHKRPSVQLVQPSDTRPTGGAYCTWMPYQVGQADKASSAS